MWSATCPAHVSDVRAMEEIQGRGSGRTSAAGRKSYGPKLEVRRTEAGSDGDGMRGERGLGYPMSEPWRKSIGEAAP